MTIRKTTALTALALTGALALSACADAPPPAPAPTVTAATSSAAPAKAADPANYKVSTDLAVAPTLDIVAGSGNVTELYTENIVEGTGAEVQPGDTVTVQYVGVGALSGKTFDSSWDRGQPVTFSLNQVITGWGQGLVGMKVGGRRLLVIPAVQAYGDNPPTAAIAPGETLVFVVDLLAVTPGS